MLRRVLLAAVVAAGASPARSETPAEPSLRVLTYNVAGQPVIQRNTGPRLSRLGSILEKSPWDVVALQEVWNPFDVDKLKRLSRFPHALRYGSRWVGNGLLTLSRHPVLRSAFFPYSVTAGFHHFLGNVDGDFLAEKGVLASRLRLPAGELDVYNTHLIAEDSPRVNTVCRIAQILELDEAVRRFSEGRRPFLLLGDFNFEPQDFEHSLLTGLFGIEDSCAGEGSGCSGTYGRRRIDYIFGWSVDGSTAFDQPEEVGGERLRLSDHTAGVQGELRSLAAGPFPGQGARRRQVLAEAVERLAQAAQELRDAEASWLPWRLPVAWWNRRQAQRYESIAARFRVELGLSRAPAP